MNFEENLENQASPDFVQYVANQIKQELKKVIIGQEEMIDLMLVSLFSGGHILIEGVPGIAKTFTAKMLAQTLDIGFSRIQFTPDLMPSDVIGTTIYNLKTSEFTFNEGPIFSNLVLIDEINRAPAKTQAALFEVMEENQVTVDGQTYRMDLPFFVIATQNPIEQEGTYKLPEAQLDRFLMKIIVKYPNLEEEQEILLKFKSDFKGTQKYGVGSIFNATTVLKCGRIVEQVQISDTLVKYIAEIVIGTRNNENIYLGASPRASLAILKTAKAYAAIQGRGYVIPEDIKLVILPVLNHRLILTPEREMEGYDMGFVINNIVEQIEVPR